MGGKKDGGKVGGVVESDVGKGIVSIFGREGNYEDE